MDGVSITVGSKIVHRQVLNLTEVDISVCVYGWFPVHLLHRLQARHLVYHLETPDTLDLLPTRVIPCRREMRSVNDGWFLGPSTSRRSKSSLLSTGLKILKNFTTKLKCFSATSCLCYTQSVTCKRRRLHYSKNSNNKDLRYTVEYVIDCICHPRTIYERWERSRGVGSVHFNNGVD